MRTIGFFTVGCAKSSTEERVLACVAEDTPTNMDTRSYCTDGEVAADCSATNDNTTNRAEFTQWTSNGFDLNYLENDTAATLFAYLVLKGGRYAVGDLLTQTDTTTDMVESSLGIGTPRAIMFFSSGKAKHTADTPTPEDRCSIGAAVSTSSRGAIGTQDDDGAATSQVKGAVEHDNVYVNIATGTTAAINGAMDITAISDSSFTCRMTDADPAQNYVWYWAIGDNAPAGTAISTRKTLVGVGL
jgi:hypothetical protein